jgi:hypothetical protein
MFLLFRQSGSPPRSVCVWPAAPLGGTRQHKQVHTGEQEQGEEKYRLLRFRRNFWGAGWFVIDLTQLTPSLKASCFSEMLTSRSL